MDIRQLQLFVCVAERLNFTEAAKSLYLTQSTVSLRIVEIEKQLDVKLFTRNTHGVKLTPAGETFLKEAKAIISSYEEAITLTRKTASGFNGTLKIGFLESHTKHFLPQAMQTFRKNYPNISLNVHQIPWRELSRGLERGELDVGLTMPQSLEQCSSLTWQTIYADMECWVMHQDHPLAQASVLDLSAVAREPFVVLHRDVGPFPYDWTIQLCANRGFVPRIIHTPRLTETLLTLVEAGEGISILPYVTTKDYASSNLRFIKLEGDDAQVGMVTAWNKANTNPAIPLFNSVIISATENWSDSVELFSRLHAR
ncbi:LysR family transcriptional regulator [Sporomusa malonica]|uniref:Transcriptional regulator, LysR family n=1 Tax=Sporomusa malonica TaxID=112901 RepID=A0A1W1ZEX5_9FIRM|nr:LysR family transcriptional regulator [Sporomusa malonica]SMC46937.1 transcriptional regulator, LysR family [Sporomusa malonica]